MRTLIHPSITRSMLGILAATALSFVAQAADHYVDGTNGNNANAGDTPRTAWRTISYALSQMPYTSDEAQTIHVAPGVYDAALGETFPYLLQYHSNSQIVGTGGSDATIVDGGGAGTIVVGNRMYHQGFLDPLTLVQGLTLRNAQTGVQLSTSFGAAYLTCRDLKIENMSAEGIDISASSFNLAGLAYGTFEHVSVSNCALGMHVYTHYSETPPAHAYVALTDCSFGHNAQQGILFQDDEGSGATLTGTRLSVVGNGFDGIRIEQTHNGFYSGAITSTTLSDSLIAQNLVDGIKVTYNGTWQFPAGNSYITTSIQRCTIADNVGTGFDTFIQVMDPTHASATLAGTILYGNGTDVMDHPTQPAIANPSFNDVGQGNFAGTNGNISIDPKFIEPQTGDYRLPFTSPCVDAGDPSLPRSTFDLLGHARPIDGNLDTLEIADIGAFEFQPLELYSSGQIGTRLRLAFWGPAGETTTVFFSRLAPVAPMSTPFGQLDLDRTSTGTLFGPVPVDPITPAVYSRRIPSDASLVGRTFSFQALTGSTLAPHSAAYTNVVWLTFTP